MTGYKKIKKLGIGGQGSVWLAENETTHHMVALKEYAQADENAKREMDVLRLFGGNGVPYLIDYEEKDKQCRIVMEYVEGKNLRSLMGQKKIWSQKECVDIACDIAGILKRFHEQEPAVIYGDLKPENVMIRKNGEICLVDFGTVFMSDEKNRKLYGTVQYTLDKMTPAKDTYALGVMMYELLTGVTFSREQSGHKADISHMDTALQKIMKKAVRIRKESGYADAGSMYGELCRCRELLKENGRVKHMQNVWMKKRQREDYYIMDCKRVVMHGYKKGLCILALTGMVAGLLFSKSETEAAGLEKAVKIQENRGNYMVDEQGILYDEYGRKVIVKK